MTVTKNIILTVTKKDLEIIRTALCDHSLAQLGYAHKIQDECEEMGIEDATSHIWMDYRDEVRRIIHSIDELDT